MQARDVMTKQVISVTPDREVGEIARLMLENRISAVPVVDAQGALVGVVSEGDLIRRLEDEGGAAKSWWLGLLASPEERAGAYVKAHGRLAREVMTPDPITVGPETSLAGAARLLEERHIKRVPVVENGRLVGILSRADLLRAMASRPGEADQAPRRDDRELRERLERELLQAGLDVHPYVNVVVSDGTIHLWGLVGSRAEAEALELAARNVAGNVPVDSHLAIRPTSFGQ